MVNTLAPPILQIEQPGKDYIWKGSSDNDWVLKVAVDNTVPWVWSEGMDLTHSRVFLFFTLGF